MSVAQAWTFLCHPCVCVCVGGASLCGDDWADRPCLKMWRPLPPSQPSPSTTWLKIVQRKRGRGERREAAHKSCSSSFFPLPLFSSSLSLVSALSLLLSFSSSHSHFSLFLYKQSSFSHASSWWELPNNCRLSLFSPSVFLEYSNAWLKWTGESFSKCTLTLQQTRNSQTRLRAGLFDRLQLTLQRQEGHTRVMETWAGGG